VPCTGRWTLRRPCSPLTHDSRQSGSAPRFDPVAQPDALAAETGRRPEPIRRRPAHHEECSRGLRSCFPSWLRTSTRRHARSPMLACLPLANADVGTLRNVRATRGPIGDAFESCCKLGRRRWVRRTRRVRMTQPSIRSGTARYDACLRTGLGTRRAAAAGRRLS
jgi:hypothetical protein